MAFIYCKNCDWSQDDFWNWKWSLKIWKFRPFGYNPISLIIDEIRSYARPRYIEFDRGFFETQKRFKSNPVHSWSLMLHNIKLYILGLFKQKWWTYKGFMKKKDKAKCPTCGVRDFEFD